MEGLDYQGKQATKNASTSKTKAFLSCRLNLSFLYTDYIMNAVWAAGGPLNEISRAGFTARVMPGR